MIAVAIRKQLRTTTGLRPLVVEFSLEVPCRLALWGPSGSGKTTFLRIFAGLSTPDAGTIEVDGERWLDCPGYSRAPQERSAVLVFQNYALFPHLDVRGNIAFAARDAAWVDELLHAFSLYGIERHRPWELSGGQQQRVALARALAAKPRFLLLDEPLAAQDAALRKDLCGLLLRLQARLQCSLLMVSHSRDEIAALTEKVLAFSEDGATSLLATADFAQRSTST